MFFISQIGPSDCAHTCLKILLANYHHDKNYLFMPCKDAPYSFAEIQKLAKEHHMELIGVKVSDANEMLSGKDFPLIATIEKKKGVKHSVLVLSASRKYVKVFDPENGKRKIPFDTFVEMWDKRALILSKEVKRKRVKYEQKVIDFIDKKDKFILPMWQLLSGISLMAGLYFINTNSYFYIPVIFFALFIIFEIFFRKSMITALKRMDESYFSYELVVDQTKYPDVYRNLEKYRYTALTIIPNLIYTMLISIFITALLVMNGIINVIYISLALVLAILHAAVFKPYYKTKSNEIAEQENEISGAEDYSQFRMAIDKAHDSAYHVALSNNLFNYLEIAVLLMTSITIMTISGIVNVIYVLFYLCISIYLKDNFVKMFEYDNHSEEFDSLLAKLLHYINLNENNSIE